MYKTGLARSSRSRQASVSNSSHNECNGIEGVCLRVREGYIWHTSALARLLTSSAMIAVAISLVIAIYFGLHVSNFVYSGSEEQLGLYDVKHVGVLNQDQGKAGLPKRSGIIVVALVVHVRGAEHQHAAAAGRCCRADKPLSQGKIRQIRQPCCQSQSVNHGKSLSSST